MPSGRSAPLRRGGASASISSPASDNGRVRNADVGGTDLRDSVSACVAFDAFFARFRGGTDVGPPRRESKRRQHEEKRVDRRRGSVGARVRRRRGGPVNERVVIDAGNAVESNEQ